MCVCVCVWQADVERSNKQLQNQMHEVQVRLDEALRNLSDFDGTKKKLAVENADLLRQLEEAEAQLGSLSKLKISISNQLEESKKIAEEEAKVYNYIVCFSHKYHGIIIIDLLLLNIDQKVSSLVFVTYV